MTPYDLKSFIALLEEKGDLTRIKCQVDPDLEIAALVDRTCKSEAGGKALLFENVKGSSLPVAANLIGSLERMGICLGIDDIEKMSLKIRQDLAETSANTSGAALKQLTDNKHFVARTVKDAPWKEVDVKAQGLDVLPALKSWPGDGGKYLTLGQVFTCHPETGDTNCGLYRVQLVSRDRALLRCHPGSGGAIHLQAWHDKGLPMPIAIALGGPPALTWAASVSLPDDVSELNYVGYLTGSPVPMNCCITSEIKIPASAEIIIEGKVLPGERLPEGPFGNHTGYYTPSSPAPVIRVESIRMRTDAIYPCTVVGPPPMENVYLAKATERMLLPLLQYDHPWVVDVHMPIESIFHRVAFVYVQVDCEKLKEEIAEALQASMLLKNAKMTVLMDEGSVGEGLSRSYWKVMNSGDLMDVVARKDNTVVVDARISYDKKLVELDRKLLQKFMLRWKQQGIC